MMAAGVLRGAGATWRGEPTRRSQRAWDAPALDPAMLKAIVLILVELMLVTAIAALLLDVLDADAVGRADVRPVSSSATSAPTSATSSRSSTRRPRRGWRAALYWVLPNLAQFDVKAEVVHGQPVAAGYIALTTRYALLYIAMLLLVVGRSSSRGATSSEATREPRLAIALALALVAAVLLAGAVQLQAARERAYPPPADEPADRCTCSRARPARAWPAPTPRWPPTSTGSARFSTTAASSDAREQLGPPPAWPRDSTTTLLYPLLDLTTTLDPLFNIAYRFGAIFLAEPYPAGPAGPIWPSSCSKRDCATGPTSGSTCRTSASSTTGTTTTTAPPPSGSTGQPRCRARPWWLKLAGGDDAGAGGDRQSSRPMWQAIRQSAEVEWLRNDAERRLLQLRALDEIDALQRGVDDYAARTGAPPPTGRRWSRAGVAARHPARSDRRRRTSSTRTDACGCRSRRRSSRCRTSRSATARPPRMIAILPLPSRVRRRCSAPSSAAS